MSEQPDKLFRDKLSSYQRPAGEHVWSRVESRLAHNRKAMWYKVAASVLIMTTSGFICWSVLQTPEKSLLSDASKRSDQVKSLSTGGKEKPAVGESIVKEKEKEKNQHVSAHNKDGKALLSKDVNKKQKPIQPAVVPAQQQEIPLEETLATSVPHEGWLEDSKDENSLIVPQLTQPTEDRITLVLSAEEVDEKYLDKKSLAEATSEAKKPSTLKKLLNKAYDLKNNQDPFGDLREKKNEILALNFKSEKQRSQNK